MPVPEHVRQLWRAMDERMGDVEPTWWGAVVTAPSFPNVWDANYARVDMGGPDLRLVDVADALLPALKAVGTDVAHVVAFDAETTTVFLTELSTLGHVLVWDLVMELVAPPALQPRTVRVDELEPGDALWGRVQSSLRLFGAGSEADLELRRLEEAASSAIGKRFFGVRDPDGSVVALSALVVLEGVGYLDNVVTFPHARGRGLATALAAHAAAEARSAGAGHVCLLADPGEEAVVRMYERLGFRGTGRLASTRGPLASLQVVRDLRP